MGNTERNIQRAIAAAALMFTSGFSVIKARDPNPMQNPAVLVTPEPEEEFISLTEFIKMVHDGTDNITGIYSLGDFALGVVQQPDGDRDFVSSRDLVFTQFNLNPESKTGTIAFLAHDYFTPGKEIINMHKGQEIFVVTGNGKVQKFIIDDFVEVRATSPESEYSDFIDLKTGYRYSSPDLFNRIYAGKENKIVFQTCIKQNGDPSWGRIFVIGK